MSFTDVLHMSLFNGKIYIKFPFVHDSKCGCCFSTGESFMGIQDTHIRHQSETFIINEFYYKISLVQTFNYSKAKQMNGVRAKN